MPEGESCAMHQKRVLRPCAMTPETSGEVLLHCRTATEKLDMGQLWPGRFGGAERDGCSGH